MGIFKRYGASALTAAALGFSSPALAGLGQPSDWQIGFQEAASPIMEQINSFNNFVTIIIIGIALFVLVLLAWVMIRYNENRNPVPSRTSHHTALEIVWTIAPILILVAIAIPSFRLLFAQYDYPKADVTINATGHQWYWSYEYPDEEIKFDSLMVDESQLKEGQPRLLTVDKEVVVPVNKNVLVQVKAADVIHNWAVPSFGVKIDAVPGRLQTTWFRATKEGMFYGQCSELCGRNHAFMPIAVRVVSEEEYTAWLSETKSAGLDEAPNFAASEADEKDGAKPDEDGKLAAMEN